MRGSEADRTPADGSAHLDEDWASALRESEARFREAANSAPAPVWMTNAEGKVEFVNLAFQEYTGRPFEDLLGDAWLTLLHPDDIPAVAQRRAAAWGAGHTPYAFEARFRSADGAWRWMEASCRPRRGDKGEFHGYVGLAVDRTEARLAEATLRASEARYRAIVESTSELICRFRPDGQILFVNSAYARASGRTVEELEAGGFWDFIEEADRPRVREMLARLTPEAPEIQIENRFGAAGAEQWFLWSNRALAFDDQGRLLEAQATGVDITERKRAEEHRQMLLDELNHRVKNTLAVVQAMAHHVLKGGIEPHLKAAFEERLSALSRAHELLTRVGWERADMGELVKGALVACGPSLQRVAVDGPPVMLSPRQALSIAMALHELCTNAMKYGALSRDDGRVDLSWTLGEGGQVLSVAWRERAGPPVTRPNRRGYGSTLIEKVVARDLAGTAELSFESGGVSCLITTRLADGMGAPNSG